MRSRKLIGALLAAALLLGACANGPRYGAARKHKKSCDCPHFDALPRQKGANEVHAGLDHVGGN
jgi:hypothetical protein